MSEPVGLIQAPQLWSIFEKVPKLSSGLNTALPDILNSSILRRLLLPSRCEVRSVLQRFDLFCRGLICFAEIWSVLQRFDLFCRGLICCAEIWSVLQRFDLFCRCWICSWQSSWIILITWQEILRFLGRTIWTNTSASGETTIRLLRTFHTFMPHTVQCNAWCHSTQCHVYQEFKTSHFLPYNNQQQHTPEVT